MDQIRVAQWGLGAMGSGMAKLMLQKEGLKLVGAIEARPDTHGKDLGDVLQLGKKIGVKVYASLDELLKDNKVDVLVQAINSFVKDSFEPLSSTLKKGLNIITIAEEMSCPEAVYPDMAEELHKLALENKVTLLGTGVNPGFVLDQLIVNLSGVCFDIESIEASRVNDLSPFGKTVMETQGVGTTPEEFKAGLESGAIVGHIGFPQSVRIISDAIGLGVDKIEEVREPIISNTERETPVVKVKPGMVAGCRHICVGYKNGKEVVKLIHPQQIHPHIEKQETGDYIKIKGTPNISMAIEPEIPGGIGTISIAVNMIPLVYAATPGLKRMSDMPIPACLMGKTAYKRGR